MPFFKTRERRNMASSNTYLFSLGQAIWSNWTVAKAVKEGYKASGWVYRAVSIIARNGASMPWVVYDGEGEVVKEHPLAAVLAKPNPQFSRQDLFELLLSWGQLAGNGYIHRVKSGNRTMELWPISPDRLSPVPAKEQGKLIAGYTTQQGGKRISAEYTIDNIVHFKLLDPSNPITGISPLEAAAKAVDTDTEQQNWNKSAMQNRGVMDGVFTFDQDLTESQFDFIKAKIQERFSGARNARVPGIVGSKAKYQRLSITPAEMDFLESRKFNREEIFIIFGVPPQLAGAQDSSTYNNFATSKRIFWENTLIPLLDDMADTFNMAFADELQEGYRIGYDVSDVTALRENEDEKSKTAKQYWEMGVPVSMLNDKMGLGLSEYEGWDKPWSGGKAPYVNAAGNALDTDGTIKAEASRSERRHWHLIPTENRNYEDEQARRDEQAEGWVKDTFIKLLDEQREAVFKALERNEDPSEIIKADHDNWLKAMRKMATTIAYDFAGTVVVGERGAKPSMETRDTANTVLDELITAYLITENIMLEDLSHLEATTAAAIIEQVADAVANNATTQQLQQAIIDTGIYNETRALMLARTLAGTAASIGQMAGGKAAGATIKEWMNSGFEVRDIHITRGGEQVDIDDKFSDQGYGAPRYPLDPNLQPADRVNCRCSMVFE